MPGGLNMGLEVISDVMVAFPHPPLTSRVLDKLCLHWIIMIGKLVLKQNHNPWRLHEFTPRWGCTWGGGGGYILLP